jgi:murein DD-endopeptidase MepM/ murein hydrolase activator NlpD
MPRFFPPEEDSMADGHDEERVGAAQIGALLVGIAVVAAAGIYRPAATAPRSVRTPALATASHVAENRQSATSTLTTSRTLLAHSPDGVGATGTVTPTASLTSRPPAGGTAGLTATLVAAAATAPSALGAPPGPSDGPVTPEPPFFAFSRPFDNSHDVRPSRYYPWGTTGRGAYLLHHGVDIGNPLGAEVRTVADGIVVYAGRDDREAWGPETDFYGQLVVIQHTPALDGHPLASLYGHVSRTLVQTGQTVAAGDVIAEVGAEGIALGPHLHLEFRLSPHDYESTVNPELMLAPLDGLGTVIGRVVDAAGDLVPGVDVGLYAAAGSEPGEWLSTTTTYPGQHTTPTTRWGENFVFGDTQPGRYVVAATVRGARVTAPVTVTAGGAWFVTIGPRRSSPVGAPPGHG